MGAGAGAGAGAGGMVLQRNDTHAHSRPPHRPHTKAYKRGLELYL